MGERVAVKKNKIAKVPVTFWEQSKELSQKFGNVQGSAIEGMRIMSKIMSGELKPNKIKKKGRGKTKYIIK
tara:strand:+ start:5388 stop:5600 length:213 start_codon:yes stop_codon:yes gene_type:complete